MLSSPLLQQTGRTHVLVKGKKLIYFGGCDYFRLSRQPIVLRALQRGLKTLGLNVAASRKTTGNHSIFEQLEAELADFFQTERAVLFSSGYTSNLATAQALSGRFTDILLDERSHSSLLDAAHHLGGRQLFFRHRDPDSLQQKLQRLRRNARVILLTDGLFAHDGSVAPLQRYQQILPRSAWMFVDDAHAAGVIGRHGRGSVELQNISRRHVLQTMTLSKAFGVYGGALLCDEANRRTVLEGSRLYAGNTPLPPPLAAAAFAAVTWLRQHPQLRQRLQENVQHVRSGLGETEWQPQDHPGPIIPLLPWHAREAKALQLRLLRAGIHPPFIHYPGGPPTGFFRFAFSSAHTAEQLDRLIHVLRSVPKRPSL